MIQYDTETAKKAYSSCKKYLPVVAVSFLILFSVVAAGGVYTQPVSNQQASTVSAQTTTEVIIAGSTAEDTNIRAYEPDGTELWSVSTGLTPGQDIVIAEPEGVFWAVSPFEEEYEIRYIQNGTLVSNGSIGASGFGELRGSYSNGTVYFPDKNANTISERNATTGTEINTYTVNSVESIDARSNVMAASGTTQWKIFVNNAETFSNSLSTLRDVVISHDNASVYMVYTNGANHRQTDGTLIDQPFSQELTKIDRIPGTSRYYGYQGTTQYVYYESNTTLVNEGVIPAQSRNIAISETAIYLGGASGNMTKRSINTYEQTLDFNTTASGVDVAQTTTAAPSFDPELEIDTRRYLNHSDSAPYTVYYTNPDNGTVQDVSDASGLTVSSSNTSVFTLNETANLVVATSDTSINQREQFNASYEGLQAQENVTVANATVDNLPILPGITRVQAVYTDSNIVLILVGTMLGVVATRAASAFAGLGVLQLTLVAGFFVDLISLGVVLTSLFAALFIGLNMAANIDYTVRRG